MLVIIAVNTAVNRTTKNKAAVVAAAIIVIPAAAAEAVPDALPGLENSSSFLYGTFLLSGRFIHSQDFLNERINYFYYCTYYSG